MVFPFGNPKHLHRRRGITLQRLSYNEALDNLQGWWLLQLLVLVEMGEECALRGADDGSAGAGADACVPLFWLASLFIAA
uniref:Uncharacterized protein n=1 Tax=Arundo donax TaxID=35708 RepID=A0A0A9DVB0_ARUDO